MDIRIPLAAALLSATMLAGCSTVPRMGEQEKLALYMAHAGAPVDDVRYTSAMGWDRIDDTHVVLNMRPRESYLLKVSGPCLDWGAATPTLGIETRTPMRLTAKIDRIHVAGSPVSCRIEEIRPIDLAGLRAARDAMEAGD
jgi:hypothetical protein